MHHLARTFISDANENAHTDLAFDLDQLTTRDFNAANAECDGIAELLSTLQDVAGSELRPLASGHSYRSDLDADNDGNVAESGVVVSATVGTGATPTETYRPTLAVGPQSSVPVVLAPLRVKAGSSYQLTVSVVP